MMSEEMETFSFSLNGKQVSFRGYYLGSVSTIWDAENQVEREEYDIFELYVDENNHFRLLHNRVQGKRRVVKSDVTCEDWQSLERKVKNTPASELLNLGLKAIH